MKESAYRTRVLVSSLGQRETLLAVSVRVEAASWHHPGDPHDLVPHVVGDGLGGSPGVVEGVEQLRRARPQIVVPAVPGS